MIAVAGHGVDLAQALLVVPQQLLDPRGGGLDDAGGPAPCLRGLRGLLLLLGLGGLLRGAHPLQRRRLLAVGRRVGIRGPQALELLVQPEQGQRRAAHVQARDELTDLGIDDLQPGFTQPRGDAAPQQEQLLVLGGAQPVDDHAHARAPVLRDVLEQRGHEHLRQTVGGGQLDVADAGLAVDAQAQAQVALRHGEQRLIRSGHGAPGEGHAQAAGARIRTAADALDLIEIETLGGSRPHGAEDREVTRDAAALVDLLGGGDVIGHHHDAGVDALVVEPLGRDPEVHVVPGVVAEGQDHAAAAVGGLGHRVDLSGRGRGEDVADHRTGREAGADEPREGRVVPGAAADDHCHLGLALRQPHDAAGHLAQAVGVQVHEAVELIVAELGGVVEDRGHDRSFSIRGGSVD